MPVCKKCGTKFPFLVIIDGKLRNLCSRKFCLECSPRGLHNTVDLTKPRIAKAMRAPPAECSACGKKPPEVDFYATTRSWCKSCAGRKKYLRDVSLKKKAIEYKGGRCNQCGYTGHYAAFDFHHLSDKQMSWRMMCNSGWDKAKVELDKCVLLCAICHRTLHAKPVD